MIRLFTRAQGKDGYVVGYQRVHGTTPTSPPINLATFEMSPQGRREATMFKNGLREGIRIAANLLEGAVQE